MAATEEDIQYWMERLPPNTPEENRLINYYRERWARLAQLEDAAQRAAAPKAGEEVRNTERPDGGE